MQKQTIVTFLRDVLELDVNEVSQVVIDPHMVTVRYRPKRVNGALQTVEREYDLR